MKAGTIEIELLANMARLVQDMKQVERVVGASMASIDKAVGLAKTALGALGLAFSVAGIKAFVGGVVDSVDALNDLSDATGSSIEKLSALEAVAMRNGHAFDGWSSTLVKFNKVLSDAKPGTGADLVLKSIGLSARELQQLDPADALQRTAVALQKYADDGAKARVVQELFGKSVKEAAPFLRDLAEAGQLNAKVTREQAEEAERFNKQLFAMQTEASSLKREVVMGLVPAMGLLLKNFRDVKELGALDLILKDAAKSLLTFGLAQSRLAGDAGQNINRVLAERAQLEADLARARADNHKPHMKHLQEEIDTLNRYLEVLRTKQRNEVMAAQGGDVSDAMSRRMEAAKQTIGALPDPNAIKAVEEQYQRLMQRIRERMALTDAEIQKGRALTEMERFEVNLLQELNNAKVKLTPVQRSRVLALLQELKASEAVNDAKQRRLRLLQQEAAFIMEVEDDLAAAAVAESAARQQVALAISQETVALQEAGQMLQAEAGLLGATEQQRAIVLDQLRIEQKLRRDLWDLERNTNFNEEQRAIERQRLEANAELAKQQVQQRAGLEEYRSMWQSIDQTAHDVFVNIFEGGSNVFKKLGQVLKASLLDLLYQMTVRKWILNIGASVTGAGGAASAVAQGASSAGGSMAGSVIGSMFGAGGLGGSLAAGAGWLTGATTLSGALSAGASLVGTGTMAGAMSGLGMIAGALGPIALGIAAIMSLIKKGGGPKQESSYDPGGMFRIAQTADSTQARKIAEEIGAAITATLAQVGISKSVPVGVHLAADPKGTAMTQLDVILPGYSRGGRMGTTENVGRSDEDLEKAIAEEMVRAVYHALLTSDLEDKFKSFLTGIDLSASAEELQARIDQVLNAKKVVDALSAIGAGFENLREQSVETLQALSDAAGGTAKFVQLVGAYHDMFLTDGEKLDLLWRNLVETFQRAGVVLPSTRDAFREAIEAAKQNVGTEQGRKTLLLLLQSAEAFNQLYPELEAVEEAVEQQVVSLEELTAAARQAAEEMDALRGTLESGLSQARDMLQRVYEHERGLLQARIDAVETAREALRAAYEAEAGPLRERIQAIAQARQELVNAYNAEAAALRERIAEINAARQELVRAYNAEAAVLRKRIADIAAAEQALRAAYESEVATLNQRAQEIAAAQQEVTSLYERQASVLTATIERVRQFTQAIRNFRDSLLVGGLTTLSPEAKLAETRRQFEATLAAAQGGDENAQSQLQGVSQNYLEAARAYHASSTQYAEIFAAVTAALGGFGEGADDEVQQQLDLLRQQVGQLTGIGQSSRTLEQAIAHLNELTALGDPAAQLEALRAQVSQYIELDASVQSVGAAIATLTALTAEGDPQEQLNLLTQQVQQYVQLEESVLSVADAIDALTALTADGDPQEQLNLLTEQVAAYGVLNDSVLSVNEAINALNLLTQAGDPVAQLAALDASVAGLLTINASVLTVPAAIAALQEAITDSELAQLELEALDAQVGALLGLDDTLVSLTEAINAFTAAQSAMGAFTANENFVKSAYQSVLGREAEREGLAYYTSMLQSGALSRDQVMANILASPENQIVLAYRDLLNRTPSMEERTWWQEQMRMGTFADIAAVRRQIMLSPEYDGSHAGGLARVPWDGYLAKLHRNERVLTANENQMYSAIDWGRFGRGDGGLMAISERLDALAERLDRVATNTGKTVAVGAQAHLEAKEILEEVRDRLEDLPKSIARKAGAHA